MQNKVLHINDNGQPPALPFAYLCLGPSLVYGGERDCTILISDRLEEWSDATQHHSVPSPHALVQYLMANPGSFAVQIRVIFEMSIFQEETVWSQVSPQEWNRCMQQLW